MKISVDELVTNAYEYLIESDFARISKGQMVRHSGTPYEYIYLNRMIDYFKSVEEYEKCQVVFNLRNKMYI